MHALSFFALSSASRWKPALWFARFARVESTAKPVPENNSLLPAKASPAHCRPAELFAARVLFLAPWCPVRSSRSRLGPETLHLRKAPLGASSACLRETTDHAVPASAWSGMVDGHELDPCVVARLDSDHS